MNKVLEICTGGGKSKLALDMLDFSKKNLVVIPKLCLIDNWKKEIKKWGYSDENIVFSTFISLKKQTNNQYDSIIIDECFSGETEILTDKGWKKFIDLDKTESVAQWEDGKISFVKPLNYIKRMHNDKMLKVHLGRNKFCLMTPNHKQVYKYKEGEWCLKEIKDIKATYDYKIPLSGYGTGNNELLTPIEKIFIAIQADGTLQRHQKNESVYSIHITKERKKERLKNILSNLNNWTKINCKRPNTDRYMVKLPKGDAKLLSTHFNINMGKDRAEDFIQEIAEWDGSRYNPNMIYYSSKIKENTDFVSAIAVQAGYRVKYGIEKDNRSESYSDIHRLYMYKQDSVDTQMFKKNEYIDFNDFVYCVEVPSHKIVVRSEGYSFISGNCHHLSERARLYFEKVKTNNRIFLSATIPREIKEYLYNRYNCSFDKKTLRDQIDCGRLPDPTVYLIRLKLDDYWKKYPYETISNKKKITMMLTQQGFYNKLSNTIEWYKNKVIYEGKSNMKAMWMAKCLQRNKQLSRFKEPVTKKLLQILKDKRVLTFCCDIKQSKELGDNFITSDNKDALKILQEFNEGKIDKITSCNILAEGISLYNCKYTIFNYINSSDLLQKQKSGRALRHCKPVIFIPYYENTREEELVNKMLELYNKDLVKYVSESYLDLKLKQL